MTEEEIILTNRDHLFPSVFHYYKEPLVISHAKDQYVSAIFHHSIVDAIANVGLRLKAAR